MILKQALLICSQISDHVEFEEWKNLHYGKFEKNIVLNYDSDKIYLKVGIFGLLIIDYKKQFDTKLISKIYPNDLRIMNTHDASDFYLKACH